MTVDAPSRTYVLGVYLKRFLRWRRCSWPYLSVDAFSNLADVSLYPPKYRQKNPTQEKIEAASVIFCPSDRLDDFLDEYKGKIHPTVIISGNSDREFHNLPTNIPSSVRLLLLQNSFISDNKMIRTLPIGVENFRFGVNGHPRLFPNSLIPPTARGRILFGPFGSTHPLREEVTATFEAIAGNWVFKKGRIPPRSYRKLVAEEFEYIACVRGNGVDTHRLWETLYRGRKPIVQADRWLASLEFLQPHTQIVAKWSLKEISHCQDFIVEDFNPQDIPEIWMPYWANLISEFRN